MAAESCSRNFGSTKVTLVRGDITRQSAGAIVNAANAQLRGGGGVDGAIHRAGGPSIMEECRQIRALQGGCDPGKAVITSAGNLQAKYVIHTVGPIYRGGKTNEAAILASAYRSSLETAVQYEVGVVAFPSISTGAYGYPLEEAASIALTTVKEFCESGCSLQEVRFVLLDAFSMDAFQRQLEDLVGRE